MKINYNKYQQTIEDEIIKELRKSMIMDADPVSKPMWANILLLLRMYNQGNVFGTFQIRVVGTSVKDLRLVERSFKVEDELSDLFDLNNFILVED